MRSTLSALSRIITVIFWICPILLTSSLETYSRETLFSGATFQIKKNKSQSQNPSKLDQSTISNVTAQEASKAHLHCSARNKGDAPHVSWVRKRDWHILTTGIWTYTSDDRFRILHAEGTNDWTLQISYVQARDAGTYECQINNGNGLLAHIVNLSVVTSKSYIVGSGEHHVDVGSVINLVCIIESPSPPQFVFWYHNLRMINYDTGRDGIVVENEPGPKTQSRLIIHNARIGDSGNYTCAASNANPASILVYVTQGSDQLAAVHRTTTISAAPDKPITIFKALFCFPIIIFEYFCFR